MNSSTTTAAGDAVKRRIIHHHHFNHQLLIPGLPDDVARICLSLVQPSTLYSVCQSWRRLIYSPSFPPFLSIYVLLKTEQSINQSDNSVEFANFDPVSAKWEFLPPPPLRLLLSHPSFISRHLPIQSASVCGKLILLAATADQFLPALSRPLVFNPLTLKWTYGPPLTHPRRWCAAGSSRGVVYVASGIGSHYNTEVARSVEKWDLKSNCAHHEKNKGKISKWEKMASLKDGKFSREAIEAVGWRGKLCMVNVKGDAAKEGIIYDVDSDTWQEMPEGMLAGWRGPAAAMEEEIIYMVDESRGALRKYDQGRDIWVDILENEILKGAEHMTAAGGRVCVVCGGSDVIAVVDVVAKSPSLVVVESPAGFEILDLHILPRMSQQDSESQ